MTYANIAALWALVLCLVATGWTHEQSYQESLGEPKYDASEQVIAACKGYAGADANVLLNCKEFLEKELKE